MSENRGQLRVVHRAELVQVGKKSLSVHGYRNDLVEQHLMWHLTQMSNKWCSVDCMAKTMFGRASEANRMGVRRRLGATFRTLLQRRGLFLVIEYDATPSGRNKIKACKIYQGDDGAESEYATNQIERMAMRKVMTEEMRELALRIVKT